MNDCTHTRWVDVSLGEEWDEELEEYYEKTEPEEEYTYEDIDTHRYKCTQCGEVFYYSGVAKSYFEDGVESQVRGLNSATKET